MIRALYRWCLSWFLRWTIYEAENYLAACGRDGLTDSLSMREFRGQIQADRIRLALLEAPARAKGARQPRGTSELVNTPAAAQCGGRHLYWGA